MSHKTKYIDVYKKYKEKGLILLSTIYTNNRIPMNCIDKNGFKYSLSYGAIKDKRKQSFNIISPYNKFSIDNMKLYIKNKFHINLNILTMIYINEKQLLDIQCSCGRKYKATWHHLQQGCDLFCNNCRKSNNSLLTNYVSKYLDNKNIQYLREYRFIDCRYKNPLPFDFYLPKYNCCIEVNGEQHYYNNKWFSQTLQERQFYDNIKKQYCIDNNIQLIILPYWWIYNNGKECQKYKDIINKIK